MTTWLRPKLTSLALAALLLPFGNMSAQTGTIAGRIVDGEGNPVNGATVTVRETTRGALTNVMGEYRIMNVPVGSQTIQVTMLGFRSVTQTVQVAAGATATADFTLQIDPLNLEGIVVTGAARPIEKLETSVAVTTLNLDQIVEKAPLNSADMLEIVPGFYVEASGGEGGNNVWARGIPQDGSFRYVAIYEDGLPVYESPELAFTNVDLLYRLDASVQTMEAVRGGTSAIFASNAPGGLVNVVSKTGGEDLAGLVRLTGGDYSMFRADVNVGGPLFGDDWRFNVGGFYRFDTGVRDPGFPANRGGQLKGNLTRLFDNGYVRVYGKYLDDRNIFYLPIPLRNVSDDPEKVEIDELAGFDGNYGTMTSLDAANVKIPTPDDEIRSLNLMDGMHPTVRTLGAEALFEFGDGWIIKDAFRSMSADVQFNAIFSLSNPFDAATFGEQMAADFGGTSYRYSYTNFANESFNPATANGNGLVAETGWWSVTKPLRNFANDLRVTKQWSNNSLTAGLYFSEYTANEFWHFSSILQEVRDAGRRVDLEILDDAGNVITATKNGFTNYANFYVNASNTSHLFAVYAQDELQATDALRLDFGARVEFANFSGNVEQRTDGIDLGDATTFADDNMTWGTGQFVPYDHSFEEISASIGANVGVLPTLNVYGRFTRGIRMPDFEQWTVGPGPTEKGKIDEIFQGEAGVKFASQNLGVFAAGFFSDFDNIQFSDEVVRDGQLVTENRFAGSRTYGIEAEVVWLPTPGLRLDGIGTFQKPEYRDYQFSEGGEDFDFAGNRVRRIPEIIASAKGAYTFAIQGAPKIFADFWYIGERFTDDANTKGAQLPGYTKVNAGLAFDLSPQVGVRAWMSNIFNTIGVTEGNPRVGQTIGAPAELIMARPILGRNLRVSVEYAF